VCAAVADAFAASGYDGDFVGEIGDGIEGELMFGFCEGVAVMGARLGIELVADRREICLGACLPWTTEVLGDAGFNCVDYCGHFGCRLIGEKDVGSWSFQSGCGYLDS
jgi:hypothetical protein